MVEKAKCLIMVISIVSFTTALYCLLFSSGNLVSLLVLLLHRQRLEMKPSYHLLITSLILWDLLYVILAFFLHSLDSLSPEVYGRKIFPRVLPILYPLTQVRQTVT